MLQKSPGIIFCDFDFHLEKTVNRKNVCYTKHLSPSVSDFPLFNFKQSPNDKMVRDLKGLFCPEFECYVVVNFKYIQLYYFLSNGLG